MLLKRCLLRLILVSGTFKGISFNFPAMTAVNLYLSSRFLGLGNRRFDEKRSIREAMTNSQIYFF